MRVELIDVINIVLVILVARSIFQVIAARQRAKRAGQVFQFRSDMNKKYGFKAIKEMPNFTSMTNSKIELTEEKWVSERIRRSNES